MDTQTFFLLQYDVTLTMDNELLLAAQSDEQLRRATYENQHLFAWSPDGQYLASASDDHTVQVWLAL